MKVERIKISSDKDYQIKCSIELQQGEPEYGESLEEELAKTLAEEIDWEIISSTLIENGWTRVTIPENSNILNVFHWVQDNIKGKNTHLRSDWIFQNSDDAAWFKLRWS